jgi:hypothetical protein
MAGILEFIATPFLLIANTCLYIAAFITGNGYMLIEVQEDNDGEES